MVLNIYHFNSVRMAVAHTLKKERKKERKAIIQILAVEALDLNVCYTSAFFSEVKSFRQKGYFLR